MALFMSTRHLVVLLLFCAVCCCLASRRSGRVVPDAEASGSVARNADRNPAGSPSRRRRHGSEDGVTQRLLTETETTGDRTDGRQRELEEALWERIQHRVLHHLRRIEGKLIDHVEQKTSKLNQSTTINYLYKVYQYLIEEVEIGKRIGEMRAGEIEKVRKIALEQGKKIVSLETDVESLRRLVDNLTQTVGDIQRRPPVAGDASLQMTSLSPPNPTTTFKIRPQLPVDCQEVYQLGGMKYDGDYFIKINPYLSDKPFEVCCRMANNAGWTVIQRRVDGSVDFYRNWEQYKRGFGDPRGEFWLGNDRIYQLTNQDDYMLRIEMSDFDGRHHYAEYEHFRLLDESQDYRIHVHGYRGDAGDSLTPAWSNHDGQPFSTYDRDNDDRFYDNCAERFHGAWWFKSCFESHLNGFYYKRGEHDHYFNQNGIQWNAVGHHYSLRSVAMMVKPNKQLTHAKAAGDVGLSNDIQ